MDELFSTFSDLCWRSSSTLCTEQSEIVVRTAGTEEKKLSLCCQLMKCTILGGLCLGWPMTLPVSILTVFRILACVLLHARPSPLRELSMTLVGSCRRTSMLRSYLPSFSTCSPQFRRHCNRLFGFFLLWQRSYVPSCRLFAFVAQKLLNLFRRDSHHCQECCSTASRAVGRVVRIYSLHGSGECCSR